MTTRSGRSKLRLTVVALASATTLAIAGTITLVAQAAAPPPISVEDQGAGCAVPALPDVGSLPSNAKLPDPFTKLNGTRITAKSDWTCRREEIKQLAEKFVYGAKPPKPSSVTGTVSRTSISVNVSNAGKSASFTASVQVPSGNGPFPVVVVLAGLGADTSTILASGAAVVNYDPTAVGREGTPRNNKQGAFYTLYGNTSPTGLLMAWAWGVSRIIDVIAASGGSVLKADAVGVTGCSRYGKGAFAVGVFDERVALTMPIESGTAGLPIYRGVNAEGGQTLASAYGEQPWFGDAFTSFTGDPTRAPIDTHELVAMVAPRGLFIMDNPHIVNLGPKSASVAALGGAEVYNALGVGDNITYYSNVQNGTHCSLRPEWTQPLRDNIAKFLTRTGNAAGQLNISASARGNLADWRTWTTPSLSGNLPSSNPVSSNPQSSQPQSSAPQSSNPQSSPPRSSSNPPNPGGCTVAFVQNPPWNTGYTVNMRITNNGTTAINGWSLVFTLAGGQTITSGWNANYSPTSGQVTATNLSYNAVIPAGGGSVGDFGFQASHTGDTSKPTSFTLNGTACTAV